MTYIHSDRADLADIGGSVTAVLADIAHHEMGDITEGWSVYDDMPTEITRLRERLTQLADAATNALADVRRLEIRASVRQAWAEAFAAGRVSDHEEQVGDPQQLNIVGVVDALFTAEQESDRLPALGVVPVEQIRAHLDVRALIDQVCDRILDHEEVGEDGSLVEEQQYRRASAVVDAFIEAVYGAEGHTAVTS